MRDVYSPSSYRSSRRTSGRSSTRPTYFQSSSRDEQGRAGLKELQAQSTPAPASGRSRRGACRRESGRRGLGGNRHGRVATSKRRRSKHARRSVLDMFSPPGESAPASCLQGAVGDGGAGRVMYHPRPPARQSATGRGGGARADDRRRRWLGSAGSWTQRVKISTPGRSRTCTSSSLNPSSTAAEA